MKNLNTAIPKLIRVILTRDPIHATVTMHLYLNVCVQLTSMFRCQGVDDTAFI